jgi:hypothetical protein
VIFRSAPRALVGGSTAFLLVLWGDANPSAAAVLTVRVRDLASQPIAARVRVIGSDGVEYPLGPDPVLLSHGTPDRYFYADDEASLSVPTGTTTVRCDRGFEWAPATRTLNVLGDTTITVAMTKVFDMRSRGWFGGDVHAHSRHIPVEYPMTPELSHRVARAEDLGIMWCLDQSYEFTGAPHDVSDSQSILYYTTEYRNQAYGHVALLGLRGLGTLGCCWPGSPPSPTLTDLYETWNPGGGQAMVLAHPRTTEDYWDDSGTWPSNGLGRGLPLITALSTIDAIDLAAYSNDPDWVLEDWYDLLSAGLRVAPSVGTDATIDDYWSGPAGGYRVYVSMAGALDDGPWVDGLAAGRSFVTNYPLLPEFAVDGAAAGEVLALAPEVTSVSVHFRVECLTALDLAEVIVGGAVAASVPLGSGANGRTAEEHDVEVSLSQSTWIAVRVSGAATSWFPMAPDSLLRAHTAPVYVVRGDEPTRNTESAARMLHSIRDAETFVLLRDTWDSDEQRAAVLTQIGDARVPFQQNFLSPPSAFTLLGPENGSLIVAGPRILFDWTDASDAESGDEVRYELSVSTDSTFATQTEVHLTEASEFTHDGVGFVDGGTYFWKVAALDLGNLRTEATPARLRFHFEGTVGIDEPTRPVRHLVVAPNPARNVVVVRMAALAGSPLAARVLDARGREVTRLERPISTGDSAEIRWDTTDRTGLPVASGRYWIELTPGVDGPRAVEPVVIIR